MIFKFIKKHQHHCWVFLCWSLLSGIGLSIADSVPCRRVVVTLTNAFTIEQVNSHEIPCQNTTIVKQYGRRLVLGIYDDGCNNQAIVDFLNSTWFIGRVQSIEEDIIVESTTGPDLESQSNNDLTSEKVGIQHVDIEQMTVFTASESQKPFKAGIASNGVEWQYSSDALYGTQVERLWNLTNGSSKLTRIAIVDGGIALLAKQWFWFEHLEDGYDFISDPYSAMDGDGRDPDSTDPGDAHYSCTGSAGKNGSSWHGTKMAYAIAGKHASIMTLVNNTNTYNTYHSMAPNATIVPLRVLGMCGSGFANDVTDAIVWAAGGTINGLGKNPQPANIISLSLGGKGKCPSYLKSAINMAVNELGSIVVVAAGNQGQDTSDYFPANCGNGVVVVAASTQDGLLASYSNRGKEVTLTAPGGDQTNPIPTVSVILEGSQLQPTPFVIDYGWGTSYSVAYTTGFIALRFHLLTLTPQFNASYCSQDPHFTRDLVVHAVKSSVQGFYRDADAAAENDYYTSNYCHIMHACGSGILTARYLELESEDVDYYCDVLPPLDQINISLMTPTEEDDEHSSNSNNDQEQMVFQQNVAAGCLAGTFLGAYMYRQIDLTKTCGTHQNTTCTATLSSIANGWTPERALDKSLDTATHTNGEVNAWWRVDFETARSVAGGDMWVRQDCCQDHFDGYKVWIGNNTAFNGAGNVNCFTATNTNHRTAPFLTSFTCLGTGRYLFINREASASIMIAEIQIYPRITVETCTACLNGTYAPAASSACLECPTGTFSTQVGLGVCADCESGKFNSIMGQTLCKTCIEGTFLASATSCTCPVGMYYNRSNPELECFNCTRGKYVATTNQAACLNCGSGTFTSQVGASVCTACSSGTFSSAAEQTSCKICANDGIFRSSTTSCVCPQGTYHNYSDPLYECYYCDQGTYNIGENNDWPMSLNFRGSDMLLYRMGSAYTHYLYLNWWGGTIWNYGGWWRGADWGLYWYFNWNPLVCGSKECLIEASTKVNYCRWCRPNHYQPLVGQTACIECPFGKTTVGNVPAPECLNCTTATKCCSPGTYLQSLSDTSCTKCWNGSYNLDIDRTTCVNCSAGYSSISGAIYATNCFICTEGKYAQAGMPCTNCEAGKYSTGNGISSCFLCHPGTFSNGSFLNGLRCATCMPGSYSTQWGAVNSNACLQCPEGLFSPGGQSYCTACPTTFQASTNTCSIANGSYDLGSSLIAYYPFNQDAFLYDASGNLPPLNTTTSSPTQDIRGPPGLSYSIKYDQNLWQHAQLPAMYIPINYTICAWYYLQSPYTFGHQRIWDFGNCAGCDNIMIHVKNDIRSEFLLYNFRGGTGFGLHTTMNAVRENTWSHICFATTSSNEMSMKYWINGTHGGNAYMWSGGRNPDILYKQNYIGKSHWGDQNWHGFYDEIRIFNKYLTDAEVRAVFNFNASNSNKTTKNLQVLCEPGTFSSSMGSSFCSTCASGTFSSGLGATACVLCPAGTFTVDLPIGDTSVNLMKTCGPDQSSLCEVSQTTMNGYNSAPLSNDENMNTLSHTNANWNEWLRIDFETPRSIKGGKFWTAPCCYTRNNDYKIWIGNNPAFYNAEGNRVCSNSTTYEHTIFPYSGNFQCRGKGRYLYYHLPKADYLHIYEFEIYPAPIGGTSACDLCPSGKFSTMGSSACRDCSPACPNGTTETSRCSNSSDRVCTPCSPITQADTCFQRAAYLTFKFDDRNASSSVGPDGSIPYSAPMHSRLGTVTISGGSLTVGGQTIPRGYQVWTVPTTGMYNILAAGAAGTKIFRPVDLTRTCFSRLASICATTMSTNCHGWVPERALDDDLNTATHTCDPVNSWWRVDFETPREVDSGHIWVRQDCCREWLDNYRVWVGNNATTFNGTGNVNCFNNNNNLDHRNAPYITQFNCTGIGRYLYVYQESNSYMSIAEIRIYPPMPTNTTACDTCVNSNISDFKTGRGAVVKTKVLLNASNQIMVVVGQRSKSGHGCGGGGGGASWVVRYNPNLGSFATAAAHTPLLVAGGGGGDSHKIAKELDANGMDATFTTYGTWFRNTIHYGGWAAIGGAGGSSGGNGGIAGDSWNPFDSLGSSAGGGGLRGSAPHVTSRGTTKVGGGRSYLQGLNTGGHTGHCSETSQGGFGGGGSSFDGGGGGGGYSGGQGSYVHRRFGGGGGSSFDIASSVNSSSMAANAYRPGWTFVICSGYFGGNADHFKTATPISAGVSTNIMDVYFGTRFAVNAINRDWYSVEWTGFFYPNVTGDWKIAFWGDDFALMWIGPLAISGYTRANAFFEQNSAGKIITLTANTYYPIRLQYGEAGGYDNCHFRFWPPFATGELSDGSKFFYHTLANTATPYTNWTSSMMFGLPPPPSYHPRGFNLDIGFVIVSTCEQGFYDDLYDECKPCGMGTFTNQTGQTTCTECPFLKSTGRQIAQTHCTDCIGVNKCCPPGKYLRNPGDQTCTNCPAGTYNMDTDQNTCPGCFPGRISLEGSSDIKQCLCRPGWYLPSLDSETCSPCENGSISAQAGSSVCSICERGKHSDFNRTSCMNCNPGTYASQQGATLCTACSNGTFAKDMQQTSCKICVNDSVYRESATSCVCPAGTRYFVHPVYECDRCQPGFSTPLGATYATHCVQCTEGNYSLLGTPCMACEPGKFSTGNAISACFMCHPGTYSNGSFLNGVRCQTCAQGTYATAWNAVNDSACIQCPNGMFSPGGQTSCTQCPSQTSFQQSTNSCLVASGSYNLGHHLIAYYPFNQHAFLYDVSGTLPPLNTTASSPTQQNIGPPGFNYSMKYDQHQWQHSAMPAMYIPINYTYCTWYFLQAPYTRSNNRIIDFGSCAGCDNILMHINQGSGTELVIHNFRGGAASTMYTTASAVKENIWTHLCLAASSSNEMTMKYWVNGIYGGSAPQWHGGRDPNVLLKLNYIGKSHWGDWNWHGAFDEIRLFNKVLTNTEIMAVYNFKQANSTTKYLPVTCPPSTFMNSTGATACFECSAGTFASVFGATACQNCPSGTFNVDWQYGDMSMNLGKTCGPDNNSLCEAYATTLHGWEYAQLGNDENLESSYHTSANLNEWWRLDLETPRQVVGGKIHNRWYNNERLNDYKIWIGNHSIYNGQGNINCFNSSSYEHRFIPYITLFRCSGIGRYIFIHMPRGDYMHTREMEVYPPPIGTSTCYACAEGKYATAAGSTTCLDCTHPCPSGTVESVSCTKTTNRVCSPCSSSTLTNPNCITAVPQYLNFRFDHRNGSVATGPDGSIPYATGMDSRLGSVIISNGTLSIGSQVIPRGYQVWTVATSGTYNFVAAGAAGAKVFRPIDLTRTCGFGGRSLCPVAQSRWDCVGWPADRAIDDFLDTATHTCEAENGWFRLDFETPRSIGSGDMWVRRDCCQNYLDNYRIWIGNNGSLYNASGNINCFNATTLDHRNWPFLTRFSCVGTGRYLFVHLDRNAVMIAEIKVYPFTGTENSNQSNPTVACPMCENPDLNNFHWGRGAVVRTKVQLKANDVIVMAVGQRATSGHGCGGGGGGASWISKYNPSAGVFSNVAAHTLILVGGGGGGDSDKVSNERYARGMDATFTTYGTWLRNTNQFAGWSSLGGAGGSTGGHGGIGTDSNNRDDRWGGSAGGGGFRGSAPNVSASGTTKVGGGRSFLQGSNTGLHIGHCSETSQGGFGGGGSSWNGGGGGGGYSGGQGSPVNDRNGGGGGSSYDIATSNITNVYRPGLTFVIYSVTYSYDDLSRLKTATPISSGVTTNIIDEYAGTRLAVGVISRDWYGIEWQGFFRPNITGEWNFAFWADDFAIMWIGSVALSGFTRSNAFLEQTSTGKRIYLIANEYYPIRIHFAEHGGADWCRFRYKFPGSNVEYAETSGFFYHTLPNAATPYTNWSSSAMFGPPPPSYNSRGFNLDNGFVVVSACGPGYYDSNDECKPCEQGTYSSSIASTVCQYCPTGQYSTVMGATSLSDLQCQACTSDLFNVIQNYGCSGCVPLTQSSISSGAGTVYTDVPGYYVHRYTYQSSAYFPVFSQDTIADVLLIGGGGGAGKGGGGAGAVLYSSQFLFRKGGTYELKVGSGGASATPGGDSYIKEGTSNTFLAKGGGAGGLYSCTTSSNIGKDGASGGGGGTGNCGTYNDIFPAGGTAVNTNINLNLLGFTYGNQGGKGKGAHLAECRKSGGGGGRGSAGQQGCCSCVGVGGNGIHEMNWGGSLLSLQTLFRSSYTSVAVLDSTDGKYYIAGGGGGGGQHNKGTITVSGGKGGGGIGKYASSTYSGTQGKDGTGSGGGGRSGTTSTGERGGHGLILIRYSTCQSCPPGYYYFSSTKNCLACPEGKFSGYGQTTCQNCPANSASIKGSSHCNGLQGYSLSFSGATTISTSSYVGITFPSQILYLSSLSRSSTFFGIQYTSYVYIQSGSGTILIPHKWPAQSRSSTALYKTSMTFALCTGSCTGGQPHCAVGGTSKICCGPGYSFRDGFDLSCQICPAGTFSSTGAVTSCTQCPENFESQAGASICIGCTTTTVCPLHQVRRCVNATANVCCGPGEFFKQGTHAACQACPPGKFTIDGRSETCSVCPTRTFNNVSRASACSACPAGTFGNKTEAFNCTLCSEGEYQNFEGQTQCSTCIAGTYSSARGQNLCTLCEIGTYSNITKATDNTSCLPCEPGTFSDFEGAPFCEACESGTYQSAYQNNNCTSCEAGTYSTGRGMDSNDTCVLCFPGTYSFESSSACSPCEAGTYSTGTGIIYPDNCSSCDVGTYSFPSASLCTQCTPCSHITIANCTGTRQPSDNSQCACYENHYVDFYLKSQCPSCPLHTTSIESSPQPNIWACTCVADYFCLYTRKIAGVFRVPGLLDQYENGLELQIIDNIASAAKLESENIKLHYPTEIKENASASTSQASNSQQETCADATCAFITHGGLSNEQPIEIQDIARRYFRYIDTSAANSIVFEKDTVAKVLVVGGGGSGGQRHGGGGGAGGMIKMESFLFESQKQYIITVGKGGAGIAATLNTGTPSNNGQYSQIQESSIVLIRASYGGGGCSSGETAGKNGASGGGGSVSNKAGGGVQFSYNTPNGYYGNNGATGIASIGSPCDSSNKCYCGAGGGGASSKGTSGNQSSSGCRGGDGGDGKEDNITGVFVVYAAGGGGGTHRNSLSAGMGGSNNVGGEGARGGCHSGGTVTCPNPGLTGQPGSPNTGSGGGGGGFGYAYDSENSPAGAGADGVVIIQWGCPLGFGWDSSVCRICPKGTMSDIESGLCHDCQENTYNDQIGATACTPCPNFTISKNSSTSLSDCTSLLINYEIYALSQDINDNQLSQNLLNYSILLTTQIQNNDYDLEVVPCPVNSTSLPGSNALENCTCIATTGFDTTQNLCAPCQPGKHSNSISLNPCSDCPLGTYNPSVGTTACLLCPTGTYSVSTGASSLIACVSCNAGTFTSQEGATVCTACTSGTFSSASAQTACKLCANDGIFRSSSTSCVCPNGTYHNFSDPVLECNSCDPGTYNIGENNDWPLSLRFYHKDWLSYPHWYWRVYTEYKYTNCPIEQVCTIVSDYGYWRSTTWEVTEWQWPDGFPQDVCDSKECLLAVSTNVNYCRWCRPNHYQPLGGQTACIECPFGKTAVGNIPAPQCLDCPTNTKCCSPGSYLKLQSDTFCTKCWNGSYNLNIDKTTCVNCSAGFSSPEGGIYASQCFQCTPGKFSPGGTHCISCMNRSCSHVTIDNCTNAVQTTDKICACNATFYLEPQTLSECISCVRTCSHVTLENCEQNNRQTTDRVCACNAGYYLEPHNISECIPCKTICSHVAVQNCEQNNRQTTDRVCGCNSGFYVDSDNITECLPCPLYTTSPQNTTETSVYGCHCTPGYYCNYVKTISMSLTLNITSSEMTPELEDSLKEDIAKAAGVPVSSVTLIQRQRSMHAATNPHHHHQITISAKIRGTTQSKTSLLHSFKNIQVHQQQHHHHVSSSHRHSPKAPYEIIIQEEDMEEEEELQVSKTS